MQKLLTFSLFLLLPIISFAEKIDCPKGIMTTQTMLSQYDGFEPFIDEVNAHHFLTAITFYDQHPRNLASLAPDNENTNGNKLVWTFSPKQEIWLVCSYKDTKVALIKKLPASIKSCTVTYDDKHFSLNSAVESIDCK